MFHSAEPRGPTEIGPTRSIISPASKDGIFLSIGCPNCGTKGAAEYEQDEPSPGDGGGYQREGAFVIGLDHPPAVHCAHCHAKVARGI